MISLLRVRWLGGVVALFMVLLATAVSGEPHSSLFATVAGEAITRAEYETAVNAAQQQRFYHGRVDSARLTELRHQVAAELIDQVLVRQEALRQGLTVSSAVIDQQVKQDLGRYRLQAATQEQLKHLDQMLRRLATERLLRQGLEEKVKKVAEPSESETRAYYVQHLDKFTTPSQMRLALILLKVAPSAPVESWAAAQQEALRLEQKLAAGADFAELALLHSSDASAERGGDLGLVHQGMLAAEAQSVVDALKVGEVSAPVALLQGLALFKLLERQPDVVNPFERVSARAAGLLQRELSEQAWEGVLRTLRINAQLEIYDKEITTKKIWANAKAAKGQ